MDDVSVVQLDNPLQTSLEYLLPGLHRDLLLDKAQEVVGQVFVHKYALAWDGIPWRPYAWTFAELGPYLLVEAREYVFGNILQDKFILSGSEKLSVRELDDTSGKGARTLPTRRDLGVVSLESVL
jgi:hypothetical protein